MPKGTHDAAVKFARAEKQATVLANLRDQGPSSVTALAQVTGLSRPTVTSILQELEQARLVDHDDPLVSGGGRPASSYRFRATAGYALAVDVLQSSLGVSVCALDGEVLSTVGLRIPAATSAEERFQFLLRSVDVFLEGVQVPLSAILGASVSSTGTLDEQGTVQASYWVPIWEGFPLGERLRSEWPFPVGVENDVNSAAFGELTIRARLAAKDLLYVRFNPRLTMGLVLAGRIHNGVAHRAGELPSGIGGTLISPDGTYAPALAETIALATAVVDPALVVVQSNRSDTEVVVDRLRRDLDGLLPPSGGPVVVEPGRLGQAAALVGGLSLALAGAMSRLLDGVTVDPPVLHGLEGLRRALRAGGHTASLVADADRLSAPPLRIGLVGADRAAELGLWAEQPVNNAQVVACVDVSAGAEPTTRGRHVPVVAEVEDLVAQSVDAVIVAAGAAALQDVTTLLEAGVPLLLEQPPSASLTESVSILETAATYDGLVVVGNVVRESSAMRAFREVITDGAIGDLVGLWARRYSVDGRSNPAFSRIIPDLDAISWLADSEPDHVVALVGGQVASLLMRLASGVTASFEESLSGTKGWRQYVAIGSAGRAELVGDDRHDTMTVWTDDDPPSAEPRRQTVFDSEGPGQQRPEERLVAGFLRQVRGGAGLDGLQSALRAVSAGLEAERSAGSGTTAG